MLSNQTGSTLANANKFNIIYVYTLHCQIESHCHSYINNDY